MKSIIKTLIFTILVPGTVTVVIPYFLMSQRMVLHRRYDFIGLLPVLLGGAVYLWCAWDFATVGQGTPAPIDPPKILVARGLYKSVRNPMYVGVILILLGECIIFESVIIFCYALCAGLVVNLFVLFYEEPTLHRKFGAPYVEYCKVVHRWLPRIPPSV